MLRLLVPLLLVALAAPTSAQGPEGTFAIRGARIIPVAGPELDAGTVLVRERRIVAVGVDVEIPEGVPVLEAEGLVLIPGLVDTRSHLGLASQSGQPSQALNADPRLRSIRRVIDSVQPEDPAMRGARAGGITTANLLSSASHAIGGQTAYVKLRGRTVEQMQIEAAQRTGGLAMACGGAPQTASPVQRALLGEAREYREGWKRHRERLAAGEESAAPRRDLGLDVLVEVLERRRTVHYQVSSVEAIRAALDLAQEFGLELVLHAEPEAIVGAVALAARIAAGGHTLSLALDDSPGGRRGTDAALGDALPLLEAAGVRLVLHSAAPLGHDRQLLRAGALALRGGLGREAALRALTLEGARSLHLEEQIGSIERGKHADLVLLSGDPFSIYTRVLAVWIDGRLLFERARPSDLRHAVGGQAGVDRSPVRDRAPIAPQVLLERRPVERPLEQPVDDALEGPRRPALLGARFAVEAEWLFTAAGPPISKGVVLVEDGRVSAVGAQGEVELPAGTPLLRAQAVTPGLIDAHASAGLAWRGAPEGIEGQSNPERAGPRAADLFDPRDPRLAYLRARGVTVVQAVPRPGPALAAQAGIFRTYGGPVQDAAVRRVSALVLDLTEEGLAGTPRMDGAARIRADLLEARAWAAQGEGQREASPRKAALARILSGELPAIFIVQRADEILTALRIAREFELRCVLSQAAQGYLVSAEIASAAAPVLVGPALARPMTLGGLEACYENAAFLREAGIPLALTSGFASAPLETHLVPAEAAVAAVNGLGALRALQALTIDAARLLGIEAERGSLERGKAADLVLWDGDPLETATRVEVVIADGRVIYDRSLSR